MVTRARVLAAVINERDREVPVGFSAVRAHQHAAGARRTSVSPTGEGGSVRRAQCQTIRSAAVPAGGPSTKIHLA
ncbi:hypothetical protein [Streptoalloteichus tenebrarius]|uniref:hypothetical protein n=1 Tax=Streptoalloteichus tenebrarius (strain ATCC 17920 / DSM 40477 / JCM 4838 / CBS 697.72 / NBRC 16177 / NCIMB 11028 / NRRL B-12390 / A12253. 1 / ISP 5477) TaxID=1933 RepID=UPI0020A5C95D|nr:hypothetical protein [Streptoalloteichus tenebrarius]